MIIKGTLYPQEAETDEILLILCKPKHNRLWQVRTIMLREGSLRDAAEEQDEVG